jgi:hypothetical protein
MSNESMPDDQARERKAFGRGFSSLSSDDFADEAPPPPSRNFSSWLQSSTRMSSRVVKYSSSDNNADRSKSMESVLEGDADDDASTESNAFLKRFLLRSPFPKHKVQVPPTAQKTVEYLPHNTGGENSPLLGPGDGQSYLSGSQSEIGWSKENQKKAVLMAAIFLMDYERGRPSTLSTDLDSITAKNLRIHEVRYSRVWRALTNLAVFAFFISSCFEGETNLLLPFLLNTFAIVVFASDIILQRLLNLPDGLWTVPMIAMMSALSAEMIFISVLPGVRLRFLLTSIPKPIALFYYSGKARNALEALGRIAPIVTRVLALELLLILSFAAVACRLYSDFDSFHDLSTAWISLFQCKYAHVCLGSSYCLFNLANRMNPSFSVHDGCQPEHVDARVRQVQTVSILLRYF